MSNYQRTGTQMMPLVDYSALSQQSLATVQQYMDLQGQETLLGIIRNQRIARVGYHAKVAYAAYLQMTEQAALDFPDAADDFRALDLDVLEGLRENIRGNRG